MLKGTFKGLHYDGLDRTLTPVPVLRQEYFYRVWAITGPSSPEFSFVCFVHKFPQHFIQPLYPSEFPSFFINTVKQLCLPVQVLKSE